MMQDTKDSLLGTLLPLSCVLFSLGMPLCAADSPEDQGISAFQHGHYVEACRLLEGAVPRKLPAETSAARRGPFWMRTFWA